MSRHLEATAISQLRHAAMNLSKATDYPDDFSEVRRQAADIAVTLANALSYGPVAYSPRLIGSAEAFGRAATAAQNRRIDR